MGQVKKKIDEYLKMFATTAKVLSGVHSEAIQEYYNIEKIVEGSLTNKMKIFKALFAEGLFLYAHSSRSKNSLPGTRAQLSLIAGEVVAESDVQPSLLARAQELAAESAE